MLDTAVGIFDKRPHGKLWTRPAVAAALIVWIDVAVVADFTDGAIDDGIPADLGGLTIGAAAVAVYLVTIVT